MPPDLSQFKGSLPYDSQLYGVFQPLLGWKSRTRKRRIERALRRIYQANLVEDLSRFKEVYDIRGETADSNFQISVGEARDTSAQAIDAPFEAIIGTRIAQHASRDGNLDVAALRHLLKPAEIKRALEAIEPDVRNEVMTQSGNDRQFKLLTQILQRESIAAAALAHLGEVATDRQLQLLFSRHDRGAVTFAQLDWLSGVVDEANNDLLRASISPVGIVHLYRQFFFEFASFLGPSVQHIWMSPGSTLELVEVSTRKTLVDRTIEQAVDSIERTEKSLTLEDEISDVVRVENQRNTKLGVGVNSTLNIGPSFISNSTSVSTSLGYETSQKDAREETHRNRREQTAKVSSQLKKSYKSVFRTVTETTDAQTRRYVLQNKSEDRLQNYELRRKMRQVGVQLQDAGTFLCWQSYVDWPGRELGIAELVHIAQPEDLSHIQDPAEIPPPEEYADPPEQINWKYTAPDEHWRAGLRPFFQKQLLSKPGYVFSRAEVRVISGPAWNFAAWPFSEAFVGQKQDIAYLKGQAPPPQLGVESVAIPRPNGGDDLAVTKLTVGLIVGLGFKDDTSYDFSLELRVFYRPTQALTTKIETANTEAKTKATEERKLLHTEALFKAARDRVKLASKIEPRKFDELREEERIVVYRNLIRQLLEVARVKDGEGTVRHVFAELVQLMFDVDQMLYFVAPEWWLPKPQPGKTVTVDAGDETPLDEGILSRQVGWNGPQSYRPDNYYVTEESAVAKLGRSLGWLIQLDGDNMRNAFLNAPWVKAVVPIRAGMEWRALRWLSDEHVEGADGLNDKYDAPMAQRSAILTLLKNHAWEDATLSQRYATLTVESIAIIDALRSLILQLQEKERKRRERVVSDDAIGYLPTDEVFEFGFDPLPGGFRAVEKQPFEIFDQWIEVVPTDQIVPVEVTYNAKTGLLL